MDLSLCCVVHNEEKNLKKMIESVLPLEPEIVIVDQASTDRTPRIAKRYADIYVETTKKGTACPDYQYAISLCRRGWILMLDADERLSSGLRGFIKNYLTKKEDDLQHPDIDVFWFSRKNTVNGIDIKEILGLDFQARLWRQQLEGREVLRRHPAELQGNVHQHPQISSARQAFIEDLPILHDRQWERIQTTHSTHGEISSPETQQAEQSFLQKVAELLKQRGVLQNG